MTEGIKEIPQQNNREPNKVDALVVLGKGYNGRKKQRHRNPLSHPSKLNALAAGELYMKGAADTLIVSGGQTKAGMLPEAEAMKEYLLKRYPIPPEAIKVEPESIDTAANAENVKPILDALKAEHGNITTGLVTVKDHGGASKQLFENYGIPIAITYASDDIVKRISSHHARFIQRRAPWQLPAKILEGGRRVFIKFVDPKGKWVRNITSKIRK